MAAQRVAALRSMGEPEKVEALVELLREVPDPRIDRTKGYPLDEVLLLVLLATISGVNQVTEMVVFGEAKLEWLRTILPFGNGIPSHDTIGRVLGLVRPEALQALFRRFIGDATSATKGVVAIDGKTARGAVRRGAAASAVHMVSAFWAERGLVCGQIKVDEKSNEITAIPKLLDMLDVRGAVVTIDAMGCQAAIVDKVVESEADCVIAVKANQGTAHLDLIEAFHTSDLLKRADVVSSAESEASAHGRGEWRQVDVLPAAGKLTHEDKWRNVRSIVRVQTERRTSKDREPETLSRFYLTSIANADADEMLAMTRQHWSIENQLHWHLDVAFREDDCRVRAKNAAENLIVVRHLVLNLLRTVKGLKGGIASKRAQAGWRGDVALQILLAGLS